MNPEKAVRRYAKALLEEENIILKKAMAIFSRESGKE